MRWRDRLPVGFTTDLKVSVHEYMISYRAGKDHNNADALRRLPAPDEDKHMIEEDCVLPLEQSDMPEMDFYETMNMKNFLQEQQSLSYLTLPSERDSLLLYLANKT